MATPVENNGPEGTEPGGQVQGNIPTPEVTPGPNPSWESVLNLIPENLHQVITPHFQEWDQAANKRIESVNAKFKDFEPFIEHGISPEDLAQGIRLINVLNNNPQVIYDALHKQLNPTAGEEEQEPEETPEAGSYQLPPNYEQLQQGVELIAQRMLDAERQQREASESAQLEKEIQAAEAKFGKLNPQLFLPFLSNAINNDPNITTEKAAENFVQLMGGALQATQAQQPYAPNLLGSNSGGGAGLPSQAIDPTKLDSTATKALVVQYLKNAQAANQRP
jgi:hypothetical protein